jgi:membrane complex biogenesis BtpA family protein
MVEVIGVVHLPRLPSIYTKSEKSIDEIVSIAVSESKILEEQGYDGVIIENYGDYPYKKRVEDPLTIAVMTRITRAVVEKTRFKVGVNILRNSGREAYAIATATGARFIRVNSLVQTIVSDSGLIEPEAPLMRELMHNYPGVEIYADFMVKHAGDLYLLATYWKNVVKPLDIETVIKDVLYDLAWRGKADKIVLTGLRTGEPPDVPYVKIVKKHSPIPVVIGSGISVENADLYLDLADGFIVGSFIKKNGIAGNPLDPERSATLIGKFKKK